MFSGIENTSVIAVTGAFGFIGSCLVSHLNKLGFNRLILIDDFTKTVKSGNLIGKRRLKDVSRLDFPTWWKENPGLIQAVFHLGARTDTTETNYEVFQRLNLDYSKMIWENCVREHIPLVYASSAATYGDGALGYQDDLNLSPQLHPLNAYGISKNEFDKWILTQKDQPPFWAGLKFFNVYGPNEFHKDRMASVIFHAFHQIQESGFVKLFRSHRPDFKDGEQKRDFVYVEDVVEICFWLMNNQPQSGLYNVGTGNARTFLDLATSVFRALNQASDIRFIDTPLDIRDKYQYFTEAPVEKLCKAGYTKGFIELEDGVADYVKNYLTGHKYY